MSVFMGFFASGAMPYHRYELDMTELDNEVVTFDLQEFQEVIIEALEKCKDKNVFNT